MCSKVISRYSTFLPQDTWQGTPLPKLFLVHSVQSLSRQRYSWTFMRAGTLVKANTSAVFVARGSPRRVKWRITSSSTGMRGDILVTIVESHLPGTPTLESTWKSTPREGKCHRSQQEGIVRWFFFSFVKPFRRSPIKPKLAPYLHWVAKPNEELFTLWLLDFHSAQRHSVTAAPIIQLRTTHAAHATHATNKQTRHL